ncbi:ABC transporter ATP-binding protein [Paralcaligenes sp. KSB-10]|uniref:ABC transporter ATP-binding protein n=1 Tax=Paralcaligenes sp. KSB-10 TaxID=2901142 RepID=UPI001E47B835|nr:ABC transporter ATP-binding protein [Paralcaligenes sp. KSB-10]UHL62744.1 ABC transporter ATP-binding protein [Paralcaligenes sp. KSB-10]
MHKEERGHSASPILLDVSSLQVAYGKAEVVHGVDFCIHEGEFVVLLGRNGAGKSSMLHAVSGLVAKKGGRVLFGGQDISSADARATAQAGLVMVLEGHRVFTGLSIEDNLLLGTYARNRRGDRAKLDMAYDLFPELAERRHLMASRLSGGQQQILAVAQGIVAEPRLLILDEPSSGLAPMVINRILTVAKELSKSGVAILLVEQLVKEALKFADYCYLVETGKIGGQGTADEIRQGELISRIYLGGGAVPATEAAGSAMASHGDQEIPHSNDITEHPDS